MLSGFQEAAQKIQEKDEYALAPFYLFYDTVHSFLDSAIRRVIERCQKAADHGDGIEQQDVNVLKLLYLIRYVDDIPANLDNIVILMADDIRKNVKELQFYHCSHLSRERRGPHPVASLPRCVRSDIRARVHPDRARRGGYRGAPVAG